MKILITGATGFVGRSLVSHLIAKKFDVQALVRQSCDFPLSVEQVVAGDFAELSMGESSTSLRDTLSGVDVVVHTAARVHVMNDDAFDPLVAFRKTNRDATLILARLAADYGVKRFIFISSVKVNGEMTKRGDSFRPIDVYVPKDPYGLSKYEAEQSLFSLATETDMEVVIIRPPLVYGPGVRANFASMMKWINQGVPLPFGAINNQRSLVALDNLVSFIIHCIDHPNAANQTFLISDGEDVSTTELLRKVAKAFGKGAWLIPVPVSWMTFVAKLLGKEDVTNRLFGSLQIDSSKSHELLGWQPVITMDEQLKKTVDAYIAHEKTF